MSGSERSGRRDLLYSGWHRVERMREFIGGLKARHNKMIDLDDVEYCPTCNRALVLIETKNSANDPASFPTYVTATLAIDAGICAFCVCYTCVCGVTGDKHETSDGCDVAEFRVRQIAPGPGETLRMTPEAYAYWLYAFRVDHWRIICANPVRQPQDGQ